MVHSAEDPSRPKETLGTFEQPERILGRPCVRFSSEGDERNDPKEYRKFELKPLKKSEQMCECHRTGIFRPEVTTKIHLNLFCFRSVLDVHHILMVLWRGRVIDTRSEVGPGPRLGYHSNCRRVRGIWFGCGSL